MASPRPPGHRGLPDDTPAVPSPSCPQDQRGHLVYPSWAVPRARKVQIPERVETMGDVLHAPNVCGRTLRVKYGPCNVVLLLVWHPFSWISPLSPQMITFKQIES